MSATPFLFEKVLYIYIMKKTLGILLTIVFLYIYYVDRITILLLPNLNLLSFNNWLDKERLNYFAVTRVLVIHIVFGVYHLLKWIL